MKPRTFRAMLRYDIQPCLWEECRQAWTTDPDLIWINEGIQD